MKHYRYEATGLARAAHALSPRRPRAGRWLALAAFAAIIGIFCRAEVLRGSATAALVDAGRSIEMKKHVAGAMAALAVSGLATAQDAVQWRVQDGGNGHWYQRTESVNPPAWSTSRQEAENLGGFLVTIHSEAENAIVRTLVEASGATHVWIGCRYVDGLGWRWIDDTSLGFTAWGGSGCLVGPYPNDPPYVGSAVAFANCDYTDRTSLRVWDDFPMVPIGYPPFPAIVEFSADCNSDGIVDFGQIRDGMLADADANNVPDCCESAGPCPLAAKQWRVQDGGNGHWYAVKRSQPSIDPEAQFVLANQLGGHAATIASAEENAFCGQFVVPWEGMLIGLRKPAGSNAVAWVTGEGVTHVNWRAGEGTNLGERYAGMNQIDSRWVDTDLTPKQVVLIEWDADCNSDGIVDFGQIRDGLLADANANNIPDCCEGGPNCPPCAADVVQDGVVNGVDLAAVINAWATDGGKLPRTDIDGSGVVDGSDLANVLGAWGPCP